jgi:hypothetical protein
VTDHVQQEECAITEIVEEALDFVAGGYGIAIDPDGRPAR